MRLREMPEANLRDLERRMLDIEFVRDVADRLFDDKTWHALGIAFATGGHTESLKFHNLGEKFAELFREAAWDAADRELQREWEKDPHDYPPETDDDC